MTIGRICTWAALALIGFAITVSAAAPAARPGTAPLISGTVTDESGQPIAGVNVAAGDYASILQCGPATYEATADSAGHYQLDVAPGTYLVYANSHGDPRSYIPEAYAEVNSWSRIGSALPVTVTTGQTVTGIDFTLPAGLHLTGLLVDGQNQPVVGAGGHRSDGCQGVEFGCALGFGTDADGAFQVTVPAGQYDLGFCHAGPCATVLKGLIVTQSLALGNVLFSEAPDPPQAFALRAVQPGYTVETVVPGGPNTPSDVAVAADGAIYLAAVRSWSVYRVGAGGALTTTAGVGVYSLDVGADGNLYGYFMPGDPGPVYRITPGGNITTVGSLPMTSCESTLAVGPAPDMDLWVGYNYCGGTGMGDGRLYRMTQAGQVYTVTAGLPFFVDGLAFDENGRLLMTAGGSLFQVDPLTGDYTAVAALPGGTASHGLVAAPDGFSYVSSQGDAGDLIFQVSPTGTVTTLATLPAGCAQGLARTPGGDLLLTMRCTGALYRVHPDGTYETVLAGNGMATPQAMAFSPAGELFVNNDEAGRIVRVTGDRGEFFARVVSYIPPLGDLAFLPTGDFYFSEAAPGFTPRLVLVSPAGEVSPVTGELDWPSGLAFSPGGTLYAVEYMAGRVSAVAGDGTVTPFVLGLTRPQALAADPQGNLYVADYDGVVGDPSNPAEDHGTNRLWRVPPDGDEVLLASHPLQDVAFGPDGELLITGPAGRQSAVLRVAPDGSVSAVVCGYRNAVGLAFDLAGDLYVSDDVDNSITRIQGFPQGTIVGDITGAGGAPAYGATVAVVSGYPVVRGSQVQADGAGHYVLPAAPGSYTVSVTAPGLCPATRRDVVVVAGQATQVDFALGSCGAFLPLVVRGP
jgi:sugar lactone lactonase YvrE